MRTSATKTALQQSSVLLKTKLSASNTQLIMALTFVPTLFDLTIQLTPVPKHVTDFMSIQDNMDECPSIMTPNTTIVSSAVGSTTDVQIRWITARAAVEFHWLDQIKRSPITVSAATPLVKLRETATHQFLPPVIQLPGTQIELFLSNCKLSCSDPCPTIQDLGLDLSTGLDIFVTFTRDPNACQDIDVTDGDKDTEAPPNVQRIPLAWAFTTTERGAATFVTCLKALLHALGSKETRLSEFLLVLWEVTHFPPAVLAFAELHGEQSFDPGSSRPLAILAYTIQTLCMKIVPVRGPSSSATALEASRQVLAWLHQLSNTQLPSKTLPMVVDKVELILVSQDDRVDNSFEPFPDGNGTVMYADVPKTSVHRSKVHARVRVRSHKGFPETSPKTLAVALAGQYAAPWDFNFELGHGSEACLSRERRRESPARADFDSLLETANQDEKFKMVGSVELRNTPSASLPLVTMSGEGLVSLYDQYDQVCGERSFFLWNVIEGKKAMPLDGGQRLLQQLGPIIEGRKQQGTWDIDAWADSTITIDHRPPKEIIVICVDRSTSMRSPLDVGLRGEWCKSKGENSSDELSRFSEVKELFRSFVSRISSQENAVHLGLVTFDKHVKVIQRPSPVLLNFQDNLDSVQATGQTAIWDAVQQSKKILVEQCPSDRKDGPKRRIVLLTDGEDNSSAYKPIEVCQGLTAEKIILDAIVIGTSATYTPFKLANHTGGYAFAPTARDQFFHIPLLETFVDIGSRPDIVQIPASRWRDTGPKPADMASQYDIPACRPHPCESDDFVYLNDMRKLIGGSLSGLTSPSQPSIPDSASAISSSGSVRTATSSTLTANGNALHVHRQIREMLRHLHEYLDVYVDQSNMGFWKVVMQGPPESPYARGHFLLYVEMGEHFPTRPPTVRFLTPVLHPNVSKHGRICHAVFDREWASTINIHQVLEQIYGMLMHIEVSPSREDCFCSPGKLLIHPCLDTRRH